MKLLSLDLMAFGPFTQCKLDFDDGGAGLHVVYGLNEAGKSSALRALNGLLFGIPVRTTDDFVHDMKDMRVGGRLLSSGKDDLSFIRRKGNKNTLLDLEEKPIADTVLDIFLGPVRQGLFNVLFGISHEDLVQGGRQILQGQGEVGESLLAAGTGGASLRKILQELNGQAEGLFKKSGTSQDIAKKVSEYGKARDEISGMCASGNKWKELEEALAMAQAAWEELSTQVQERTAEKTRLERLDQALPLIARRQDLLDQLAELGEVIILPADFRDRRQAALAEKATAARAIKSARDSVERVRGELEALAVPVQLLEQEENVTSLHDRLIVHNKAVKDLPPLKDKRTTSLARAQQILNGLRPELPIEDAAGLREGLSRKRDVRDLDSRRRDLDAKLQSSGEGIQTAGQGLEEVSRELQLLEEPRDASVLKRKLEALARQNLARTGAGLAAEIARDESQAGVELARLKGWTGTLEELERAPLPKAETVDRFDQDVQRQEAEAGKCRERISEIQAELAANREKAEAARAVGEVPGEGDLEEARARREDGWKLVRRSWIDKEDVSAEEQQYDQSHSLPEAYELSVAGADEKADLMRREADRVAANALLAYQVETGEQQLAEQEERARSLEEQLRDTLEQWRELWAPAGVDPLPPREMRAWLMDYGKLIESCKSLREKKVKLEQLETQMEEAAKELAGLLASLGEKVEEGREGLEGLEARGGELVEKVESTENRRSQLDRDRVKLERELEKHQASELASQQEMQQWEAEWADLMDTLGLSGETTPTEAQDYLDGLQEMVGHLDEAASNEKRILDMGRDAEAFTADVEEFVGKFAPDLEGWPVEQAVAQLKSRMDQAKVDEATRREKQQELEGYDNALRDAGDAAGAAEEALTELYRLAGCETPEGLEAAEERSNLHEDLERDRKALEEELVRFRGGGKLEDLLAEAEAEDADAIPARLNGIKEEVAALDGRKLEAGKTIGAARENLEKMDGNDQAALKATEAKDILDSMQPLVEKYVKLRLASMVLRQEVERMRQEQQGPMLARAGAIFSRLTEGSFRGLEVEYGDQDQLVIVGVRENGEKLGVEGMSDGTCDQLYLALRLAYIDDYLEHNEPMPLIVDDILIRFDDKRANAALKVLLELSDRTQVIFFTHHAQLVGLAKELTKDGRVQVHTLGGPV